MKKTVLIIILILVLAGIGAAGYLFFGFEKTEWQTYISEEYGFEIEYPEAWEVDDLVNGFEGFYDPKTGKDPSQSTFKEDLELGGISFTPDDTQAADAGPRKDFANGKISIKEFVRKWSWYINSTDEESDVDEWITFEGYTVFKIKGQGNWGPFTIVYIPHATSKTMLYTFNLVYPNYPKEKNKQYDKIFKHMISSFRFLK